MTSVKEVVVPEIQVNGKLHKSGSMNGHSGKYSPTHPGDLSVPVYLVNPPFSYATSEPNNVWMTDLTDEDREPDLKEAMNQFVNLYKTLSRKGLVYILPTPRKEGLQDLVFVANLGIALNHLKEPTVVLSNFTSKPRIGETQVGLDFFKSMGYKTYVPETKFEGEADLKYLYGNVYIGGYGMRSDLETYKWMEKTFDMKVIPLKMTNERCYHLDCSVFPVTKTDTLVCTELYTAEELAELSKYTNVIDVPLRAAECGICNSVKLGNTIVNGSDIKELEEGTEDYKEESFKNKCLEDVATRLGLDVEYVNIGEYLKSGALLSCMVMHLNRQGFEGSSVAYS